MKTKEKEGSGDELRCSDGVHVRDNCRKRAGMRRFSQVSGQLLVPDKVLQKYTGGRRCAYDSSLPSSCCPNDSDASWGSKINKTNNQKFNNDWMRTEQAKGKKQERFI